MIFFQFEAYLFSYLTYIFLITEVLIFGFVKWPHWVVLWSWFSGQGSWILQGLWAPSQILVIELSSGMCKSSVFYTALFLLLQSFNILCFVFNNLAMLRGNSWFNFKEIHVVVLRGSYGIPKIEPYSPYYHSTSPNFLLLINFLINHYHN